MSKLLKISVILMLLLSGAALAMGYLLFGQRVALKGRTQKLETAVKVVAGFVETGDETGSKVSIPDEQLSTFKQEPGGPQPMDIPLNQLTTAAKYQLERLNVARADLVDVKETLSKSEEEFKAHSERCDELEAKTVALQRTVADKERAISDKEVLLSSVSRERDEADKKIGELEEEVSKLLAQHRDLNDRLSEQVAKMDLLSYHVDPTTATNKVIKGRQGMIIHVDPDWNFVIFDLSPDKIDSITPDIELLVHRGDRFVGKVKVAKVDEHLAVADIIQDWQQMPVQKNDEVIY